MKNRQGEKMTENNKKLVPEVITKKRHTAEKSKRVPFDITLGGWMLGTCTAGLILMGAGMIKYVQNNRSCKNSTSSVDRTRQKYDQLKKNIEYCEKRDMFRKLAGYEKCTESRPGRVESTYKTETKPSITDTQAEGWKHTKPYTNMSDKRFCTALDSRISEVDDIASAGVYEQEYNAMMTLARECSKKRYPIKKNHRPRRSETR
jgi:hypothetical protein